ncbi:MAG: methyltransferase domain-containing protein [Spirochaetes bacterium]|nr:MAG: methyltransferase domain-containing protein [Spirochaetota bacterium]
MTKELGNIVNEIVSRIRYKPNDIWLDIACNDGTLIKQIPNDFIKLGIDPCDDSFYKEASQFGKIVQDYFSFDAYQKTGYGDLKAKIITTIAMFYDLEDANPFIQDINRILDDNGIWVIQLSYTPLMLKQLAFDNICHEHIYYHSLNSIKNLITPHNLKIVDASLNDVNGGSIRIYMQKNIAQESSFANGPLRDVCNFRIQSLLEYENSKFNIGKPEVWEDFDKNINALKKQTVDFIKQEKAKGKIICGYGASTKGNTLLQWFGLDNTLIDAIAERSPYKFGLKTIGTNIPIKSEEEIRLINPDYILILPWHFISEFIQREDEFLSKGGKFIIPCPKFEIYEK